MDSFEWHSIEFFKLLFNPKSDALPSGTVQMQRVLCHHGESGFISS